MADAFVSTGMKAAGYTYVNVDDCWMAMNRTDDGKLTHDTVRFPSGMKALARYVHERGLKFGVYSARCGHTCQGRPGSQDHEWLDAQTFASWDVDYLKYDNCGSCKYGYSNMPAKIMQVTRMGDALRHWGAEGTGRPIFYSTEMGGEQRFNADICNSAREGSDIAASWESVLYELDVGAKYADLAAPGYHNDFDMLEIGNGQLTPEEEKAHMAIWCLMSSPLLAGNNLTATTPEVIDILTAPGPLSINQDELALQVASSEPLPKPKIPEAPKAQEQKALQSLWTANGAAVSAASGLLAFTGGKAGQPAVAQPAVAVRDFWGAAPGQLVGGAQQPPKNFRWKRTTEWEADVAGEAKRAAAQPPPKKCRWKRVVAMAGKPTVGQVVG